MKSKFHIEKSNIPYRYDYYNHFYPDFNPSNIILTLKLNNEA